MPLCNHHKTKVAILSKFSAYGGISRMMVHLANGLIRKNVDVDLLIAGGQVPFPENIAPEVTIKDFQVTHVYAALPSLIRYLNHDAPDAILATRHKNISIAILAHMIAKGRQNRRLAIRLSGNLTSSIAGKNSLQSWLHNFPIRYLYHNADAVIAVSEGVAQDFRNLAKVPPQRVSAVPNPTISEDIGILSQQEIDHPWFKHKECPIILGAGRFTRRKDFITLIRAFAFLRQKLSCRLVLLGDGQEKKNYWKLAQDLGIERDIYLPGFTPNPYAYMAKSDVFALTSKAAEGSPNVIKEALALGLPVVSTDCPSGPREILQNGKIGRLAPVEDSQKVAKALEETLRNPPDPNILQASIQEYTIENSTMSYMKAIGL
jgi:glycosyltransferase involved in cell wall biosynthesis